MTTESRRQAERFVEYLQRLDPATKYRIIGVRNLNGEKCQAVSVDMYTTVQFTDHGRGYIWKAGMPRGFDVWDMAKIAAELIADSPNISLRQIAQEANTG